MFKKLVWAVCIISVLLHAANLHLFLRYGAQARIDIAAGPDTPTYRQMADNLLAGEAPNPMYQERLLVPLVLAALKILHIHEYAFLWLVCLLALPATAAAVYLTRLITGHRAGALVGGILFALYPNIFQYETLIETDAVHTYLAVMAVGCTMAYVSERSWRAALGAAVLWPLAQLARPTLFGIAIFIVIILWPLFRLRETRISAMVLCASSVLVPGGLALHNALRFGIPSPSLCQVEMLHVWTIPRMQAITEARETGERISALFYGKIADFRQTDDWRILHGKYEDAGEFRNVYREILTADRAYLRSNWKTLVETSILEFRQQLSGPLRYYNLYSGVEVEKLYPDLSAVLWIAFRLGFAFSLLGWGMSLAGKQRAYGLLVAGIFFLTFAPASLSFWAGPRYRMLTDAISIPLVVLAGMQWVAWSAIGLIAVLGYMPMRFMNASTGWFRGIVVIVLAAAGMTLVLKERRTIRQPQPK